ncbi:carboxypeptidase-like regulatory domain-containing protein [Gilvimarinus agarilyticus]|uniref:carboxypeptidase-like regulatory domain-containing protein n=1 Tax=Reichenbachiella agariperforans TaxID=156994 RepID=UPI001C094D09|nr:carboxypeptidase-like regulatory domain-containing protein [Reichenbachiella agariperforans]MBU2884886.1 carboxypeptidase-like regulatory domain-containing protein [Gilvimarinus agarilyticus]MBU2914985.1 carboxypeptidase-like regulatory domain-containing protein [Reichenbachiella agariperforans]
MRYIIIVIILLVKSQGVIGQVLARSFQLLSEIDREPVAYAHVVSNEKLLAISDLQGRFKLDSLPSEKCAIKITCVGFKDYKLSTNQISRHKATKIYLKTDEHYLNEVTVKPENLKGIISTIYNQISNKYFHQRHLLLGTVTEEYVDTSGHVNMAAEAIIEVAKSGYSRKTRVGDVKLDKVYQYHDIQSDVKEYTYSGAHIPHRFDFVMQRFDFISHLDRYDYIFRGEFVSDDDTLEVIEFKPKDQLLGGDFRGLLYLNMTDSVFAKAEYSFAKDGNIKHQYESWKGHRKFLVEYKEHQGQWFLARVWNQALDNENNFLLRQSYFTNEVFPDSTVRWDENEKHLFHQVLVSEPPDSVNEKWSQTVVDTLLENKGASWKNKWLGIVANRFVVNLGVCGYFMNSGIYQMDGSVNGDSFTDEEKVTEFNLGLYFNYHFLLVEDWYLGLGFSESFGGDFTNKNFEVGLTKEWEIPSFRPSYIVTELNYSSNQTELLFGDQKGWQPTYETINNGVGLGMGYEVSLGHQFGIGVHYSFLLGINRSYRYFAQRNSGFLDLKKNEKSLDEAELVLNEEPIDHEFLMQSPHTIKLVIRLGRH